MKLCVVGTGYVGLVSGACFSEFGHYVTCVDKDAEKIKQLRCGKIPIYEPGLDDLVARNAKAGRLAFSTDLREGMKNCDAVFIAVGTPSRRGDGHADLTYVFAAIEEIGDLIDNYVVVVTKSTVPVGTGKKIEEHLLKKLDPSKFDVASNPEFLREGSAIDDFMRPDRVVVGSENEKCRDVLRTIYRPLNLNRTPMVLTSRESAEIIKYASNAFLATKISFINEIADLCEAVGGDVQDVARGMGMDGRIGPKFLHPGPGYGGSCFPKDTLALLRTGEEHGVDLQIVKATVKVNDERKVAMAHRVVKACGGSVDGKRIAILGLTFKPNTDDVRESPALVIIPELQKQGAKIAAYDPEGMDEAAKELTDVEFCSDAYAAITGADAMVIVTEWNEFRALDINRVHESMNAVLVVDLRNVFKIEPLQFPSKFLYKGIGVKDRNAHIFRGFRK